MANFVGNRGGKVLPPFKVAKQVTLEAKKSAVSRRLAKRKK